MRPSTRSSFWIAGLLLACGGGGGGGGAADVSHEEREPFADVPVTLPEAGVPDSLSDPGGCDDCDAPDAVDAQSDSFAEVLPGQPGAACKKNGDCVSGFCIETLEGRQCAEYCFAGEDTCPPGYRCSQVQAYPDTLYVCVFLYPRLCRPCSGDEDCAAQLAPGPSVCIPADPAGRFCGSPCEAASDCPPGYDCRTVTTLAGAQVQQCVRSAGECACSKAAVIEGASTPCFAESQRGRCEGVRVCTAGGLTDCSAPAPVPETCNGLDDDCDGLTDDVEPVPCVVPSRYGDCPGTTACEAGHETCRGTPANPEACNSVDDDCDGQTDEEGATGCSGFYRDEDLDTYGASGDSRCLCAPEALYTATRGGDCDDRNDKVHPGVPEVCNDLDDNCDGTPDEEGASGCTWFIRDEDQDGFGAGLGTDRRCLCRAVPPYTAVQSGDCDDLKPAIHPGASETCNGLDDDCDGLADPENAPGCIPYFQDKDGDAYGDPAVSSRCLCAPDPGFKFTALRAGDCNDSNAGQNPAATEVCNAADDDCDGETDEPGAVGCIVRWRDEDADGWGIGEGVCICREAPPVTATKSGDCDDRNAAIHPGATETCNGLDDDCDGATDEEGAGGCRGFYLDQDGDGWGLDFQRCLCGPEKPYQAELSGDCDDQNAAVNPGRPEQCGNQVDDDCDGATDEEGASGCGWWHPDTDRDGWGSAAKRCLCGPEGSYDAPQGGDCNDADPAVHPGAAEACNARDDDCDGATDEEGASGCRDYYLDADADGHGVEWPAPRCLCAPDAPSGYTAVVGDDCDDGRSGVYPGAAEACDGLDNDCDGATDEDGASGCRNYYFDADADGHGVQTPAPRCLCAPDAPSGYTAVVGDDCDDARPDVHPGAQEACNGRDDDCDGTRDGENSLGCEPYYRDQDQDGFGTEEVRCLCAPDVVERFTAKGAGDCNDLDPAIHPGARICGKDADCDGNPFDAGEACDDGNSTAWDGCTACEVTEARINVATTGDQGLPAVAALATGGYAVAYRMYFASPSTRKSDIGLRWVSSAGLPSGSSDTIVNTTWSGEQVSPAVAALPGGGLVVVWQSDAQDGDSWGVFARVADASGAFPAGELQVNAYTAGAQSQPRVVALGSNDLVVVWQSYGQDGDGTGVFGRRLPSSGTTFGPEYAVNLSTAADQSNPAISRLSDDRVIVVWQSDTAVPGVREIRWRILAADGAPASGEYTANTPVSTATCSWPDVAVLADDRFVIAWEREEGGDSDVYARWFASDGSPQGAETRLNVEAMGDQLRPRLGAIPDGRLVATWMSDGQDGSYFGVFVRRFDADRLPAGGEFQANTFYTGEQSFPAVSTDATGGALVVWQSLGQDGSGYGVYGRRFP